MEKVVTLSAGLPHLQRSASFSRCGRYRYVLTRTWSAAPAVAFLGLNPSTADHERDDPTIRRCLGFARQWGCGGLVMLNLFAYRATDPRELLAAADPIGPDNDTLLLRVLNGAESVIAAWGAAPIAQERAAEVLRMLAGRRVECLGTTRTGCPRHPLYLPGTAAKVPFALSGPPAISEHPAEQPADRQGDG